MAPLVPPPPFLTLEQAAALETSALASDSPLSAARAFSGSALVDWLVSTKRAASREDAARMGQSLLDHRLAHHATDDAEFEDSSRQTYAFLARESEEVRRAHADVSALLADARVHQCLLKVKRTSMMGLVTTWDARWVTLDPASTATPPRARLIRVFKRRSAASAPVATFEIRPGSSCTVRECLNCLDEWYCFTLEAFTEGGAKPVTVTLCADHSKRQEGWIAALGEAGVRFVRDQDSDDVANVASLYDLSARLLNAQEVVPLAKYRGRVTLVVNISSNCGLTPKNNPELIALQHKYHDKGLDVLMFPVNFGGQEPGTEAEIDAYLHDKWHVDFPVMEKTQANGPQAHPVFKFCKSHLPGLMGSSVKWNYTKFLVDRDGKPVKRYGPLEPPSSFEKDIVELLETGKLSGA